MSAAGTMSTASTQSYPTVRVAGALLTADLIGRIGAGDSSLDGLRSEDYGLLPGRRLGEAASRRWDELLGAYQAFKKQLEAAGPGESRVSLTRERWLQPLFAALDFGRLQYQRGGLTTGEGHAFPVSHLWQNVPIHLPGWDQALDRKGGNGHRGRAPQSMLQDFLNTSDDHLWGIVSNGRRLRILRDAASLSEAAFIEFDLESMFEGELYPDFVLLFALAHASRFEVPTPETEEEGAAPATPSVADCWLEKWRTEGDRTGIRFRDKLRDGLKAALEELGTGFVEANPALREKLRRREVTRDELRDELLRLAYQVLFLFVAEDKNALLDPAAGQAAKDRYKKFFSTGRLRTLATERLGDQHDDLWRTLTIVLDALGADEGREELALPPLGGLYFTAGALDGQLGEGEEAHPELLRDPEVTLPNRRLLAAVRHLTRVRDDHGRWQRVDYQHLDAEELGSVYESLLELIPYLDTAYREFELKEAAGNDRKTTGSYYTPTSLVETLLDSALDPVITEYAKSGVPADLLKITVCDPACGSGHFLVAAARRIAKAYAVLEAGDEEPAPDAIAQATPEVVRNCVYGVDLNPLAVELTKVSLWLASIEPGKPLAFLDPHIKVGNALLGVTPRLLEKGIPDGAFKRLEGDEGKFVAGLKKRNKQERQTLEKEDDGSPQISLWSRKEIVQSNIKLVEAARRINEVTKPGLPGIREQARELRKVDESPEKQQRRQVADAWCAAFVWPKHSKAPDPVTTHTLYQISRNEELTPEQRDQLDNLTHRYQFFHWNLEFPDVFPGIDDARDDYNPETGWQGGFNCVLGNPPWERVKLQEKEFFASRDPEIAGAANKARRQEMIDALPGTREGDELLREFHEAKNRSEGISLLLRDSGRYPRTGSGDVNTYAVFAETASLAIGRRGRFGLVLPTGIGTDVTTGPFFSGLVDNGRLASFLEFENEAFILSRDVHHSFRFCLLAATGLGTRVDKAEFAFGSRYIGDLQTGRFAMPPEEIRLVNPNTGTVPVFRSRKDAEITLGIYRRVPVLVREGDPHGNPWGLSFMTMFHMANDSHLFRTREELEEDGWHLEGNVFVKGDKRMLPLYEAKMLHHYDHRLGTYEGQTEKQANVGTLPRLSPEQHADPEFLPMPRYWAPDFDVPTGERDEKGKPIYYAGSSTRLAEKEWDRGWFLGWRDIARATDERTMIGTVFPRSAVGHTNPLMFPESPRSATLLQACISSFVFDYATRQKLAGTHLTYSYLYQLPVPKPSKLSQTATWELATAFGTWLTPRSIELTYTAWDMEPFARDLGDYDAPFVWDEERRFLMRCELDAAFFHLYGIERDDVKHIMDTFPVVKRRELATHGTYRTKDTILEIYDAMAKAAETGEPYRTVLDPPLGEGPRHAVSSRTHPV